MTFVPGMPRVPGSGRAKGTENRATALTRVRVQSAMEMFRDTPDLVKEITSFLQDIARARTAGMSLEQIAALPREELMLLQSLLSEAAKIALKSMEFAYPKLQRVDHVGNAPAIAAQQRTVVTLHIPRPAGSYGNAPDHYGRVPAVGNGGAGE
jgi:hypothetical protein